MKKTGQMVIGLFVFANLLNYLDRYVLAAVLNPIGQTMGLNDAQLGSLALAFLLVYLLSAPLFSYLAERYSRMKIVAAGIALWSLATGAAALAVGFKTLLLTRALVGIGEAAYATIGPAVLADLVPEKHRAKVFTWFYLAIPVGSAIGFAMGGLVEGLAGWRASFLVAGIPGLILSFFFWRMAEPVLGAQENEVYSKTDDGYWQKLRAVLGNRTFVACTLCYVGYTFAMGALTHWAPTLFQRRFDQSPSTSGTLFGAIAVLTGIAGTFLGGEATHRLQARYPQVGIWISMLTLLAALPFLYGGLVELNVVNAYLLWAIGMFLLFINTSPINAITVSCLPAPLRATGMAANIFFVHLLGDAISPAIVGNLSLRLGSSGTALASALMLTVPAIFFAGLALIPAIIRRPLPMANKSAMNTERIHLRAQTNDSRR